MVSHQHSTMELDAPSPLSRRSFSLPITRTTPLSDPQIEVLYSLLSARIVSFSTSTQPSRPSSSSDSIPPPDLEPGTLSWASRFESTIAVGTFPGFLWLSLGYTSPQRVSLLKGVTNISQNGY